MEDGANLAILPGGEIEVRSNLPVFPLGDIEVCSDLPVLPDGEIEAGAGCAYGLTRGAMAKPARVSALDDEDRVPCVQLPPTHGLRQHLGADA